ncbi:AAA family ATPase [Aphanizomenon sp. CS-733/32]|uniref:ATP-dependent nuclease n=1 Tax=Aphanizomenon sp. CS-733/32 TaxID=3021715 RepID=UPI00232D86A8|nr:AAA family ATPase [Aphanizomenon sp. CS-733/32]MDB9310856.1 AAA family ATPase [Aphanizomenon sp. CS-733/32]
MVREHSIADETLNKLLYELQNNNIFALVGENMSGKTELMRRFRNSKKYLRENIEFLTLHIELPLNQYLISHNDKPSETIRSDEVIKIVDKIQNINSISPNNDILKEIIANVNTSLKVFHENSEVVIREIATKTERTEPPLNKVIRTTLGIGVDELNNINKEDLKYLHECIIDLIQNSNFKPDKLNNEQINQLQKCIKVVFDGRSEVSLTQASAGLGVLVSLIFVIEAISYFQNINCLLLIDELEAYLHPAWQKKLIKYLQQKSNERINIIFSTHSQHLILTDRLDSIGLVKYSDKKIDFEKLFDNIPFINPQKDRELNILKPIEDALGLELNIFSTPFITVEGEEEMMLFSYLFPKFTSQIPPRIINLHGKDNLIPYILLSKIYEEQNKSVFVLDADVNFGLVKHIEKRKEAIIKLQNRFIFIGKKLYDFQELYPNNDLTKHTGNEECLEDFFAVKILGQNNQDGYEEIRQITKDLVNQIEDESLVNKLIPIIENNHITKFKDIKSRIGKFSSSDPKISNQDKLIQKIKNSILNKVLAKEDKLENIRCLINQIHQKITQL